MKIGLPLFLLISTCFAVAPAAGGDAENLTDTRSANKTFEDRCIFDKPSSIRQINKYDDLVEKVIKAAADSPSPVKTASDFTPKDSLKLAAEFVFSPSSAKKRELLYVHEISGTAIDFRAWETAIKRGDTIALVKPAALHDDDNSKTNYYVVRIDEKDETGLNFFQKFGEIESLPPSKVEEILNLYYAATVAKTAGYPLDKNLVEVLEANDRKSNRLFIASNTNINKDAVGLIIE